MTKVAENATFPLKCHGSTTLWACGHLSQADQAMTLQQTVPIPQECHRSIRPFQYMSTLSDSMKDVNRRGIRSRSRSPTESDKDAPTRRVSIQL